MELFTIDDVLDMAYRDCILTSDDLLNVTKELIKHRDVYVGYSYEREGTLITPWFSDVQDFSEGLEMLFVVEISRNMGNLFTYNNVSWLFL